MAIVEQFSPETERAFDLREFRTQLKDYVGISEKLIWQRQAIFFAAMVLTAFYFDPYISIGCYSAVLFSEAADLVLSRRVQQWNDLKPARARMFLGWALFNTALSAGTISIFIAMVALQQDPAQGHFTPLFFLFAAALFAAMNNHQIVPVLALRLGIYAGTFLFIVLIDIWRLRPPLDSDLWLQFFTVVFVLYFIIDCSIVFLHLYRKNLRALEELTREHERTKAALEIKSQFVSTVSHELRTPLTSIKGSLDLLQSGALGQVPEAMQNLVDIATKNAKRLSDLINDILDLQRLEAGETNYRMEPVDVRHLVLESIDANQGYADGLGISLDFELPEDRSLCIMGDEKRLMQVMANIISNAVKFSEPGGTVRVRSELSNDKVRILIEDDGIGIPEDAREKVFGKFTQVDGSDQRRAGGTGLGMNITRQIVEQHGGRIDYDSELGRGTTFFVEFDRIPCP